MTRKSDIQLFEEAKSLLSNFKKDMGYQLALNMNKGGWQECSKGFLLDKIKRNIITLENSDDPTEVRCSSANVANYCAMYSDNFKR